LSQTAFGGEPCCAWQQGFSSFPTASHLTPSARLPRDVPAKPEGIPADQLCRSLRAALKCTVQTLLAALDEEAPPLFQPYHAARRGGWRIVSLLFL
jgi:hypothetical protein